ncbi:hypothetical protein [Flavobacterium aquicola]|uniref:Uncharacterized protein n=1 Tax=Flavobacterium aquicola TaxID=1682742 RepID=A0A3E0ES78_9FLAO|nr:hypothetical protein [Flavobacterium aquicola]REH01083.1 hypothetical protein C8P67_102341 [Flavobacterium aquicola]
MQSLVKTYSLPFVFFCLIGCGSNKSLPLSVINTEADSEHIQQFTNYEGYSTAIIVDCGQGIVPEGKIFSLLGDYDGGVKDRNLSDLNFSGWNHTINGSATEWTNLKLEGSNYSFNSNAKANNSCNNVSTLDIILLKKIADWNHQHSNGFECNILSKGYKFGDIKSLVFDLKINTAKTRIPTVENIKKMYVNYVNDSIVDALDEGKVNIGITLGDNTNFNGSIIFQLDQAVLGDKWVRVTIPMDKLLFYQEINYKKTVKKQADLNNIVVNRMLIVGETKSGAVLRRNISPWNDSIPEIFKEMDVSFKKIELQLK